MNKIYRFSMVVAVALSLVAAGCSPDSADEPVPVDKVEDAEGNDKNPEDNDKNPENNDPIDNTRHDLTLAEGEAEIITSYNSRSLAVLDRLATDETKNVYTSGVSLNILLSMFANGVTGEARAELLDYLGANSLSELNALNTKLMDELVKLDKESVFHIANSLWAAPGFTFLPSCLDLMDATYHASSYSDVPLSTLQGMDEVNKWCSEKTEGLIPKFLDEPLSSPCLAVNALYFKGKWMNKFDETLSSIRVFTAADGTTGYASYMEGFQHVRTCEENGNLCLKIPFGNGAFEFDIIMPAEGTAVSSLLADPQTVSMLDKAKESIARVRLPKFKIENKYSDLVEILKGVGLTKLFTSADFSDMTASGINSVDKILQKNIFEINEKGAESATVTGGYETTAPDPASIPVLVIDRPFMFAVRETSTGLFVSTGVVNKI